MPFETEHYRLEAFTDVDRYSASSDRRRFSTLDNQFYSLGQIIGDGVISGWDFGGTFPYLTISPGAGIIDGHYVTTFNNQVFELSDGSTYYVYAQRRVGIMASHSSRSDLLTVTYENATPPATPANFDAVASGAFAVALSWDANTEENFDHYELQRRPDYLDDFYVVDTISDDSTTYTDTTRENTRYYYRLYAVDESGYRSEIPATDNVTTPLSDIPPPNPSAVEIITGEGAVTLLWKQPSFGVSSDLEGDSQNNPCYQPINYLHHYKITYTEIDTDGSLRPITAVSENIGKNRYKYRIDDLSIGQRYRVVLQTVDIYGRESDGVVKAILSKSNPAPRDPVLTSRSIEESPGGVTINLAWEDGWTEYDPEVAYRYRIYIQLDGERESSPIDIPLGFYEEQIAVYTFNYSNYFPIPENRLVTVRITALDMDGNESRGYYDRFITTKYKPTLPIYSLTSTFVRNKGAIEILWRPQGDTDLVHLVVYECDPTDEYCDVEKVVDTWLTNARKYTLTDVSLGKKYAIHVTPYNDCISGETATDAETTPTSDQVPLAQPPTAVDVGSGDRELRLSWTKSLTAYAYQYKIYRMESPRSFDSSDWTLIDTLPAQHTYFVDYGLENETTYVYYITSVDIYGRESLHLADEDLNVNFVSGTPYPEAGLEPPFDFTGFRVGTTVHLAWNASVEEFDSFTLYRSAGDRHSWQKIATLDKTVFTYTDTGMPLVDGMTYYYLISKSINDSDFVLQTSQSTPENAILIGHVRTENSAIAVMDETDRRNLADLEDPLADWMVDYILNHSHSGIGLGILSASRISLDRDLVVTDWETIDGQVWTTEEDISGGQYFILRVNERIPRYFYSIDEDNSTITFSEPIVQVNRLLGKVDPADYPSIELRVVGLTEVRGTLSEERFDDVDARQIAFGQIPEDQLPTIDHEGRIKETLTPKAFLLQRYSNHTFIIPEGDTDTSKHFGDGTTFYATVESDGLIEEVIDFDLFDDDELVGFQEPFYSDTTIDNLKQNELEADCITGDNPLVFGEYVGAPDTIFIMSEMNASGLANISQAQLAFSAYDADPTSGQTVNMLIEVVDPSLYNDDTITLSFLNSFPGYFTGISGASVYWSPPPWTAGERSANTTVSVRSLVASFLEQESYRRGRTIIFKITVLPTTPNGSYRKAYATIPTDPYDPYLATSEDSPLLTTNYVEGYAGVNSDPGGFQSEKSYKFSFEFEDTEAWRWIRLPSQEVTHHPNPAIKLGKRLRFRIYNNTNPFYLTFGIREITAEPGVGEDGGTTGPIEWVGTSQRISAPDGSLSPRGIYVPTSSTWQEIDIDIKKQPIFSFSDGDGVLTSNWGVIEHLAVTADPLYAGDGDIEFYIDKLEQLDDVIVAGTSQGILVSSDFGGSWITSRLTDTPVHKFYRASNNRYLWAISPTGVFLCTDPAHWFKTTGTTGIEYIRDIAEDPDGDMFISTDKGVYWLEIAIIDTYPTWRQTQPVNAFTSDCYALAHTQPSWLDEYDEYSEGALWVSTELGIYSSTDKGQSWSFTGLETESLPVYEFIDVGDGTIFVDTRKHILRKRSQDADFSVVYNFELLHDIYDIWKVAYFARKLYVATGSGLYVNDLISLTGDSLSSLIFRRALPGLDTQGALRHSFGLDVVAVSETETKLFIGQEGRIMAADEMNRLSLRREWPNQEIPSFFLDSTEAVSGYVYNAFNNVLVFREPVEALVTVKACYLPRRVYEAANEGWSHLDSNAEVFVYFEGSPRWIDFRLDIETATTNLLATQTALSETETLTTYNSDYPNSATYLAAAQTAVATALTELQSDDPNRQTAATLIAAFLSNLSRFMSSVTATYQEDNDLSMTEIPLEGRRVSDRSASSRAAELATRTGVVTDDCVNIAVRTTAGEIDFTQAYAQAVTEDRRADFTFTKYDTMKVSIYAPIIDNIGDLSHAELEDGIEQFNTGMSSGFASVYYANLLKLGIGATLQNTTVFDGDRVTLRQAEFHTACTHDWYDIVNSTIDFSQILTTSFSTQPRRINVVTQVVGDEYHETRIWLGTDAGIVSLAISDGLLSVEDVIHPDSTSLLEIYDIFESTNGRTYACCFNNTKEKGYIYYTTDSGDSWTEIGTINLPEKVYRLRIIHGKQVVSTESGIYYCDNALDTWYQPDLGSTKDLESDDAEVIAFNGPIFNLELSTFLFAEGSRWFFVSGSGLEYSIPGQITRNSVTVVNRIHRFKSHTWVATNRGLYDDANSLMSNTVDFGLQEDMDDDEDFVAQSINVTDVTSYGNALYCSTTEPRIYRYLDETWTYYDVDDFGPIHYMTLFNDGSRLYATIISHMKIRIVDITEEDGVFD